MKTFFHFQKSLVQGADGEELSMKNIEGKIEEKIVESKSFDASQGVGMEGEGNIKVK